MILSTTQPDTLADGNCLIYALIDQLSYDNVWGNIPFSHYVNFWYQKKKIRTIRIHTM